MPTYQYRCKKCGCEQEVFQRMSDDALTTCPECKADEFERVISAEGGFLLKGKGFHSTDYAKKSACEESPAACPSGKCPLAK